MDTLPNEILVSVLLYLPPTSFYTALAVSRRWHSVARFLRDPEGKIPISVDVRFSRQPSDQLATLQSFQIFPEFRTPPGVRDLCVGHASVDIFDLLFWNYSIKEENSTEKSIALAVKEVVPTSNARLVIFSISLPSVVVKPPRYFRNILQKIAATHPTTFRFEHKVLEEWRTANGPLTLFSVEILYHTGFGALAGVGYSDVFEIFPNANVLGFDILSGNLEYYASAFSGPVRTRVKVFSHRPWIVKSYIPAVAAVSRMLFSMTSVFPNLTELGTPVIGVSTLFALVGSAIPLHAPSPIPHDSLKVLHLAAHLSGQLVNLVLRFGDMLATSFPNLETLHITFVAKLPADMGNVNAQVRAWAYVISAAAHKGAILDWKGQVFDDTDGFLANVQSACHSEGKTCTIVTREDNPWSVFSWE